jgi:hypothetical protein
MPVVYSQPKIVSDQSQTTNNVPSTPTFHEVKATKNVIETQAKVIAIDSQHSIVQTETTYVLGQSEFDSITFHDTGANQEYYPGKLNTRWDGTRILDYGSTEADYLTSEIYSSHAMGVPHPTEIKATYNDPNLPESLAHPMGFNTDNPTVTKDRSALVSKLGKKIKTDENYDTSDAIGFNHPLDIKSFLPDLNPYALIGDPRYTLGAAIQITLQEVLPLINKFLKSVSPLATTVNEQGLICDSDGNPIPPESLNSGITFDSNGVVDLTKANDLFKPPTVEEIKKIFEFKRDEAYRNQADAFIKYLRDNFLNIAPRTLSTSPHTIVALPWKAQLIYLLTAGMFIVRLTQEIVEKDPVQEVVIIQEIKGKPITTPNVEVISEVPTWIIEALFQTSVAKQQLTDEIYNATYGLVDISIESVIGSIVGYFLFPGIGSFLGGKIGGLFSSRKNRDVPVWYYAYRYANGYIEEKDEKSNVIYNPYNIPSRDDPDAPVPPAQEAVYADDPRPGYAGRQIMIKPPMPAGRPGRIETIDYNMKFKRYYPDQKEYISTTMGLPLDSYNNIIADQKHIDALLTLADPIPDYLQR